MAKNEAAGHGRRGPVKNRFQSFNPLSKRWVKSNAQTGKFLDVKADSRPFKSIRRHKNINT